MSYRILYVEDEENLAMIVRETMALKGFTVQHEKDGQRVMNNIENFAPDICVLDVMLPNMDGFAVGKLIRKIYPQMPIIFLTAKSQTKDVLEGFASGGTDYIKKPFSIEELMARINSQMQLLHQHRVDELPAKQPITLGSFTYYPHKMALCQDGKQTIQLSNRETEILNVFCAHINEALDRRELMLQVWEDDSYFISRNLDVYVRKLRRYFAEGTAVSIMTLKGKGYLFVVE